jgi:tetratricopeptide (TPR) repeat protein
MRQPALGRSSLALACVLALFGAKDAWALDAEQARGRAEQAIRTVEAEAARGASKDRLRYKPPTPAQRLAAGDMLLRNKDYDRAIDELSKVVELRRQGKMPEAPFADGSFLLAEAYFQSRQYLSARRQYREVLEHAGQAAFLPYVGRSLSRLVDVALRTNDLEGLDYVFARLNTLPASDQSGSLNYARAKALFAKGNYAEAKSVINTVPANSEYTLQAQYLLGVIMTKESTAVLALPAEAAAPGQAAPAASAQRYAQAVEQFRRVTRMPAKTAAARHVIDFSWMAIGRLLHESDDFLNSAEAYSHVDRQSPEFANMLHELSWVYVRLGDFQRAQRALEVLTITDPNNLDLADGSLLRADLMLRAGQYDKALGLYRSVRGRFDPIREQVERFMATNLDPAVYYDRLTADPEVSTTSDMPEIALEWARQQAEDERVFSVIDDANRSRDLLKKARKLAARLSAVLAVPTRAKAFPETRAALETTLSLLNRVGRARVTLAEGMDDVASGVGGELGMVRQQRRALMRRMGAVPVSSNDFARRDDVGYQQWSKASQALQELTIEADKLRAIINGLRRVLSGGGSGFPVTSDGASRERFRLELEANERDLEAYQRRIQEYRDAVDMGRIQAGFGDQRFVDDEQTRLRFKELLAREVELCAAGHDSGSAAEYALSIRSTLARADVVDKRLEGLRYDEERHSLDQSRNLAAKIRDEIALLESYASTLERLDVEARQVVGEVAMKNFARVRDRLKSVVLRADVGIVQQAWEMREEQRRRLRGLQRERAREEQNLNDELREVIDDAEDDR